MTSSKPKSNSVSSPQEAHSKSSSNQSRPAHDYEAEIQQWQSLVWYIVNRLKPRLPHSVSEEELFAAGMVGLMKATRSYDPTRGAEFKTYAYHRIRGAMLDELRTLDFLPRSLREKAKKEGVAPPAILSLPTDEDGSDKLEFHEKGQAKVENAELMVALQEGITELPEKMRMVMHLYYNDGCRMREIGERLGLTESRVSQIHSASIARLRRNLRHVAGD